MPIPQGFQSERRPSITSNSSKTSTSSASGRASSDSCDLHERRDSLYSVGSVDQAANSIPFDAQNRRAIRASSIIKRFQSRVSTRFSQRGSTLNLGDGETVPKKHKRESHFFNQLAAQAHNQNKNLLVYARSFLPSILVQCLEAGFWSVLHQGCPALRHFPGSTIAIEFIGVDALSTHLLQRANGDMHVSKFLDKFFVLLIDVVMSYRGDVIEFTGNSLIVFFEAIDDHERFNHVCGSLLCSHTPEELSCLRAAACCLELHKRFRVFDAGLGDSCPPVSIACGVGTGTITLIGTKCGLLHTLSDYVYTVAGAPMRRAAQAARLASQIEERVATVLAPEAWKLIANTVVEGTRVAGDPEFRRLKAFDAAKHTYPMVRHAAQQSFIPKLQAVREFDAHGVDRRLMMSLHFLHHSVRVHALAGHDTRVSASRKVSMVFFKVRGIDPTTDAGARNMESLAADLIQAANTEEGSMLKLTATDQSLLFYFAFGLPPLLHLDDPKRACTAAFNMVKVILRYKLACNAGVVTDRLFCGVLGSEKHREYSAMGAAMQRCASISAHADAGCVLVDSATFEHCSSELEFIEREPIVGFPRLEPTVVFQLLHPQSGKSNADQTVSQRLAKQRPSKPISCSFFRSMSDQSSRQSHVLFSPPCTPPWLSNALSIMAPREKHAFPTLWTCIWCQRPSPYSLPDAEVGRGSLPSAISSVGVCSAEPWQTQVPVALPWPARSIACGGVSPVPSFSSWRIFSEVERKVAGLHADGGGMLCLVGAYGSGKTELAEHLAVSAVRNKSMLPVFGAMEMRAGSERHAVIGILRGVLALLEPAGKLASEDAFKNLLSMCVTNPVERVALEHVGLALTESTASSPKSRAPSGSPRKSNSPRRADSPRRPPSRLSASSKTSSGPNRPSLAQSPPHTPSGSVRPRGSLNSVSSDGTKFRSVDLKSSKSFSEHDEALIGIATRLLRRLLEQAPVVMTLRASQGTSRLVSDLTFFWSLVRSAEAMALNRGPGLNELLVIVVCQEQHLENTFVDEKKLLHVQALTPREILTYTHLCLSIAEPKDTRDARGVVEESRLADTKATHGDTSAALPAQSSEMTPEMKDASVPHQLVHWLARLANVPRYIEECLTELHRCGVIKTANGRCSIKKSLDSVKVSDWIHTHMVSRVVSEAEALSPEKQEVLQVATLLKGPFTALDLAAANRVGSTQNIGPQSGGKLLLQRSVQRLTACRELVRMGLLRPANEQDVVKAKYSGTDAGNLTGSDLRAPAWVIPSVLIHHVIGSSLFQSHRMKLKRAILINRAITEAYHRRIVGPRRGSSFASIKMSRKQQRWREQNERAWRKSLAHDHQKSDDFPTSCLVTPIIEESESLSSAKESDDEREPVTHQATRFSLCSAEITGGASFYFSEDMWKSVDLVDFLPMRYLRWLRWLLVGYSLILVAFGIDLTIVFDGSRGVLDRFFAVAMVLVFLDLVAHVFLYSGHFRTLHLMCNLLVFVILFFEVSWAAGPADDEFLATRRSGKSIFRVPIFVIKVGACICRMSEEIKKIANWIEEHPGRWLKAKHQRYKQRYNRNAVQKLVVDSDETGSSEGKVWQSKQLGDIGYKVSSVVLVTLTVFTVLTVLSIWLTDYSLYPDEDASMATWVQLIGNHLTNRTPGALKSESYLAEMNSFQKFYKDMEYGPYSVCRGLAIAGSEDFACKETIWRSIGDSFSQPSRPGFVLYARSSTIQAAFDFTAPAKLEAWLRCCLFLALVLCTIAIAVAVDYVVNSIVITPLTRIFSVVRMMTIKLEEHVPDLHIGAEDEGDEVSMLETAVDKLVLFVTASKPVQPEQKAQEWLNAYRRGTLRGSEFPTVVNAPVMWQRPSGLSGKTDRDDEEALKMMGVELDDVDSWSFNVFTLLRPQLHGVTGWMLMRTVDDQFKLRQDIVANFVELIADAYQDGPPYHNWRHAVDVHHTLQRECMILSVHQFLSPVDTFALLVAAIGHDVGHPGFNNPFLELTSHELALRYNDKSPLENMHCATMFGLMLSHPEAQIFSCLNGKQYKDARQVCIQVILHTDNAKHFEMLKELQMLYATNCETFDLATPFPSAEELEVLRTGHNRELTTSALMHGADISNACKPWRICTQWADLVISEFFRQGDEEKRLGIPVQMLNDRDTLNKPSSQVAFIEFFVAPFYKAHLRIFAPLWLLVETLQANLQRWHAQKIAEVEMEEDKRETAEKQVAKLREELKEHADKGRSKSNHVQLSKKDAALLWMARRHSKELSISVPEDFSHSGGRLLTPSPRAESRGNAFSSGGISPREKWRSSRPSSRGNASVSGGLSPKEPRRPSRQSTPARSRMALSRGEGGAPLEASQPKPSEDLNSRTVVINGEAIPLLNPMVSEIPSPMVSEMTSIETGHAE